MAAGLGGSDEAGAGGAAGGAAALSGMEPSCTPPLTHMLAICRESQWGRGERKSRGGWRVQVALSRVARPYGFTWYFELGFELGFELPLWKSFMMLFYAGI